MHHHSSCTIRHHQLYNNQHQFWIVSPTPSYATRPGRNTTHHASAGPLRHHCQGRPRCHRLEHPWIPEKWASQCEGHQARMQAYAQAKHRAWHSKGWVRAFVLHDLHTPNRKVGTSWQVQYFVTIVLHCYRDIGRVVQEKWEFLRKSRNSRKSWYKKCTKISSHVNIPAKLGKCTKHTRKSKHTGILYAHYKSTNLLGKL